MSKNKCTGCDWALRVQLSITYGIDYFIGEELYVGKGLGKGIITLLVDRIFLFPDALHVTADIDRNNKASETALLSCGFVLLDDAHSRYVKQKPQNTVHAV